MSETLEVVFTDAEWEALRQTVAEAAGEPQATDAMIAHFCKLSILANMHVSKIIGNHIARMEEHWEAQRRGEL